MLIDRKPLLDITVKNKEETYEAIIEMGKTNDYTTSNLLDYEYFFRVLQIDCNRFEQTNSIRKS